MSDDSDNDTDYLPQPQKKKKPPTLTSAPMLPPHPKFLGIRKHAKISSNANEAAIEQGTIES